MSTSVTRWAMIGTGWMAEHIASDFQLTENVELTTIVSRSPEKAAKFAAEWDIPNVVTNLDELWAMPDIDVVYIATPHPAHFAAAKAAILAGKHVLVEKPMTMTAAQSQELADLAREAGVFLMEAMWTRFLPAVRKAQELIAAGEIGNVRNIQASFGFPVPLDPDSRMWKPELGGGSTLDQGVYTLLLPYLIFGKPSSVVASGALTDAGVDSEATVLLGYPGGEQAVLTTSLTTFLPQIATIGGSTAQIQLGQWFWATNELRLWRPDDTSEIFTFPKEGNNYVPMLRAVSEAVLAGKQEHELNPLSDTVAVLEIVEEIIRQINAKSAVSPHPVSQL